MHAISIAVCKFKCKVCDKVFDRKSSWVLHERIHLDDRPLTCKTCQKAFQDKSLLNKHLKTECNDNFSMYEKTRSSAKEKFLSEKTECTQETSYKCDFCFQSFIEELDFNKHVSTHLRNDLTSKQDKRIEHNFSENSDVNPVSACFISEQSCVKSEKNSERSRSSSEKCESSIYLKQNFDEKPCKEKLSSELYQGKLNSSFMGNTIVCNKCDKVSGTDILFFEHCCEKESPHLISSHRNSNLACEEVEKSKLNYIKDSDINPLLENLKNEKSYESPEKKTVNQLYDAQKSECNSCLKLEENVSEKELVPKYPTRKLTFYVNGLQFAQINRRKFVCCKCKEEFQNRNSVLLHFCTLLTNSTSPVRTYIRSSNLLTCKVSESTAYDKVPSKFNEFKPVKPFICDICKQHFNNKAALNHHLHYHIGTKFVCEDCQDAFDSRKLLGMHQRSSVKKKFRCNVCRKYFCHEKKLNDHYKIHEESVKLSCGVCSKFYSNKFILYLHYFSHAGSTSFFICKVCFEIFKDRNSWVSHYCHHAGTKPYICELCHKFFVKKKHLYLHCRIHTDEKPYICEICQKTFKYFSTLSMHKHVHKKK